jgi:hypothetical protein
MGVRVEEQETVLKGGFFVSDRELAHLTGSGSDRHTECHGVGGSAVNIESETSPSPARPELRAGSGNRGRLPPRVR